MKESNKVHGVCEIKSGDVLVAVDEEDDDSDDGGDMAAVHAIEKCVWLPMVHLVHLEVLRF